MYQIGVKMGRSLSDEEMSNGSSLMLSQDPENAILGAELFNSYVNTDFTYDELIDVLWLNMCINIHHE